MSLKLNLAQILVDRKKEPLKEPKKAGANGEVIEWSELISLRFILGAALHRVDDKLSWEDSIKCGKLAEKVYENTDEVEFTIDEISFIKERVKMGYKHAPLIAFQVDKMLEGKRE